MRKMSVVQDAGKVEITIVGYYTNGYYTNEVFTIEQSELGLAVSGRFVSNTFGEETGSICLSPIGDGKIELYIG